MGGERELTFQQRAGDNSAHQLAGVLAHLDHAANVRSDTNCNNSADHFLSVRAELPELSLSPQLAAMDRAEHISVFAK